MSAPCPARLAEGLLEECVAYYVAAMLCNLRVRWWEGHLVGDGRHSMPTCSVGLAVWL